MAFQSNFPNNISGDNGSSIGDIKWSSADLTQAGFLVANGAEVGRATYPDLCAVYESMGFPWGAGDGSTTFNLPNLIGKFAEGADSAGGYHEAGLPNITGSTGSTKGWSTPTRLDCSGAFSTTTSRVNNGYLYTNGSDVFPLFFDASKSNSIYGNSDTVQPPSALLIPYVKAFAGASANSTDLAITEVANEVAGKANRSLSNVTENVDFVVDSYSDADGNWYRVYKSGWVEQGGICKESNGQNDFKNYNIPFKEKVYHAEVTTMQDSNYTIGYAWINLGDNNIYSLTTFRIGIANDWNAGNMNIMWYACGK